MLKRILVHAISYWHTTDNPQIPDFLPLEHHNLFQAQSQIGWSQVLKGRWSTQWVKLHGEHAQRNKSKMKGENWGSTTICHIWEIIYDIWKHRSNTQHEQVSKGQATFRRLEPKVPALYSMQENLDHVDKWVLDRPLREILALQPPSLDRWVHRTDKFVKAGIKQSKQQLKLNTHSITTFFTPENIINNK
jgi:hypothetical protein